MNKTEYKEDGYIEFWEIQEDKNGVATYEINKILLNRFLIIKGFGKYYLEQTRILVRINENIIKVYTFEQIRDYIIYFIRYAPNQVLNSQDQEGVLNLLLTSPTKYMSNSFLELLEVINISEQTDTKDTANFYFKNCWVTVTKAGYKVKEYSELRNPIWKSQIINKDFKETKPNKDFDQFIKNICNNDSSKINSLRSIIGYLLHSYKDPSLTKAVIFCDDQIGELLEPKGRSGKSLLTKAIGQLKNTVTIDGKNFNFNKNFAFQNVDLSTQIINFNDVRRSFPFEQLFSVVTEGITIEKKYQHAYTIPYEKTPKIVISTNYSISGNGDSFAARVIEFALSDHYNMNHQPIEDFDKRFFDEWDENDWNVFFIVLFAAVTYYLNNGLVEIKFDSIITKKIIQDTSPEFYNYMQKVELGKEYNIKELYETFQIENPGLLNHQRMFTNWLQKFASYKGYKYAPRKSNNNTFVTLSDYSKKQ